MIIENEPYIGWVGVPPSHPLYGINFYEPSDAINGKLSPMDAFGICITTGKLGIIYPKEPDNPVYYWWFGFFCDGLESTINECESLAEQLNRIQYGKLRNFTSS